MYINGMRVAEDLHAIDITRAVMSHWFKKLKITFNPLDELEDDFYEWRQILVDEEGAQVHGSFELLRAKVQIHIFLEWCGPNAALIRSFCIRTNSGAHDLGFHIVRRVHGYDIWGAVPRNRNVTNLDELKKLLAI